MKTSVLVAAAGVAIAMAGPVKPREAVHTHRVVTEVVAETIVEVVTVCPAVPTICPGESHDAAAATPEPEIPVHSSIVSEIESHSREPAPTTSSTSSAPPLPATSVVVVTISEPAPAPTTQQPVPEPEPTTQQQVSKLETTVQSHEPKPEPTTQKTEPKPEPSTQAPVPQPTSSTPEPSSAPSLGEYPDTMLRHHNLHRANHSAPGMEWDTELAGYAETIAKGCVFEHDMNQGKGGYGQNLASWGTDASDFDSKQIPASAAAVTEQWYNGEVNSWQFYGMDNPPANSDLHLWGHFTQLVWKDSTKLGCYTAKCGAGTVLEYQAWYTVCNYGSPGNYGGEYGKNVLPPLNERIVSVSI